MFTRETDDGRGQVGIGTLIVFIAMVLVAAIAAGVLINTAGFLQSQAEATGEESTDLVSERIDVVSAVGIVEDPDDDSVDPDQLQEIRLDVTGAAGSNNIDLSETIIQAVGPNGQENLVLEGEVTAEVEEDEPVVGDISAGMFAVQDEDGFVGSGEAVLNDENDLTIVLNPAETPFGDEEGSFSEGESSTLDIVSPSGATTQIELTAPDLFTTQGEAVRL